MPQGRRKVPFSGKAKKLQMKAKKQRKGGPSFVRTKGTNSSEEDSDKEVLKVNHQPRSQGSRSNANRYALQFYRESDSEIQQRKEAAFQSLSHVPETELEITINDFFTPELDFPKRPPWNFDMSREQLEAREHRYFTEYVSSMEKQIDRHNPSYVELNLETWRQLWRVLEMSDIILVIVDIRFAALMFPPSLYSFVRLERGKDLILVLNKVDLAPAPLVVAWKYYFKEKFPDLHVIMFTSFPGYNLRGNQDNKQGLQIRRRKGKLRMAAEGAQKLFQTCKEIVKDQVDLSSWNNKILEEMEVEYENEDLEVQETVETKNDTSFIEHQKYRDGTLTIGCVGQPNVGKSSLLNAIMGKKVVSVSRSPGHTKHFQTIYLTSNVRLCDCPGLVFPSRVPKTVQVLMGCFPIAQLREPFSVVRYLAERLDLPRLLSLQHPEGDDDWSAMDVCNGWALKRGFYTARAARLDAYRGANHLLRMALEGKICLCLRPSGYSAKKGLWESHEEVQQVLWIQARVDAESSRQSVVQEESDFTEEEEGEDTQGSEGDSEPEDESVGLTNKFLALSADD